MDIRQTLGSAPFRAVNERKVHQTISYRPTTPTNTNSPSSGGLYLAV